VFDRRVPMKSTFEIWGANSTIYFGCNLSQVNHQDVVVSVVMYFETDVN